MKRTIYRLCPCGETAHDDTGRDMALDRSARDRRRARARRRPLDVPAFLRAMRRAGIATPAVTPLEATLPVALLRGDALSRAASVVARHLREEDAFVDDPITRSASLDARELAALRRPAERRVLDALAALGFDADRPLSDAVAARTTPRFAYDGAFHLLEVAA